MKTIILGAAGLLLSTSALAATPQAKGMSTPASPTVAAKDSDGLDASMIGNAITIDWPTKRADARAIDRKHIITAAKAPLEAPAAQTPSTLAMSEAVDEATYDGVGGPDESVDTPAVRAFAARDYPACTSEADDSCIQLYERGVPESLSSWQASHGGQQVAMGGPEEPIEDAVKAGGEQTAADQPLPEDAVMPASEDMVEKDAPDTSAI